MSRKGKEFSDFTKDTAFRHSGNKCVDSHLGDCEGEIEFDHILPIWICIQYFPNLSSEIIKSVANCAPRCEKHHTRKHQINDWAEYYAQAAYLESLQARNMFE